MSIAPPKSAHSKGDAALEAAAAAKPKRRKDDRPAEIVAAGLAEFAEKGFAATRLDDVAKRAGIAKGTIYRYFDDKEALFLASMETLATPAFGEIEGFLDATDLPTREVIKMLVTKAHVIMSDGKLPVLMGIILKEGGNFPQLTELYYHKGVGRGRELLARIVRRGIERGELKENAATRLPIVLVAPVIMSVIWNLTFNNQAPIEARSFVEAHVDLVFEGIWAE